MMIGVQEVLAEAIGQLALERRAGGAANAHELDSFAGWIRHRPINDPEIIALSHSPTTGVPGRPWPSPDTLALVATLRFDGSEAGYAAALRQVTGIEIAGKIDADSPLAGS